VADDEVASPLERALHDMGARTSARPDGYPLELGQLATQRRRRMQGAKVGLAGVTMVVVTVLRTRGARTVGNAGP
jgi:hypothetical protein